MNSPRRFLRLSFSLLLGLAALAPAQERRSYGGRDDLRGLNYNEITRIINDCESRTNRFKRTLDKALARENVRAGQAREDQLNRNAQRLEDALDRVGDSWNKDRSYDRTRSNIRQAVAYATDINSAMRRWDMGSDAEREWGAVRIQLDILAAKFGTPKIR
jgi:hypothetical protein